MIMAMSSPDKSLQKIIHSPSENQTDAVLNDSLRSLQLGATGNTQMQALTPDMDEGLSEQNFSKMSVNDMQQSDNNDRSSSKTNDTDIGSGNRLSKTYPEFPLCEIECVSLNEDLDADIIGAVEYRCIFSPYAIRNGKHVFIEPEMEDETMSESGRPIQIPREELFKKMKKKYIEQFQNKRKEENSSQSIPLPSPVLKIVESKKNVDEVDRGITSNYEFSSSQFEKCTITISSGKKSKLGTDANVYIVLYRKAKANDVNPLKITIPGRHLKHEEPLQIIIPIADAIERVGIGHDDTGESPDWFCERITILWQTTGTKQVFPCRKWLSTTKGDGAIFRTIYEKHAFTKEVLCEMCKQYGRKSPEVVKACEEIRLEILSLSRSFKDVLATYKPATPDDIVFVIFTEEGFDRSLLSLVKSFKIIHRTINEYSEEDHVTRTTEICIFSESEEDDRKNLTDILQKNGNKLMDTHSNLNIITPSPVKSKQFTLGKHKVKRKPCIVFYVCIKGYIPIQEEELPPVLGKYKTDVREGAFMFYNDPEQYMQRLKMGCSIGINEEGSGGTLGAFVDLPNGKIGCITSAHVLFNREELRQFNDRKLNCSSEESIIYQPAPTQVPISETNNPFGHILSAVYRKGGKRLTGVEAAVITITDSSRYPDSGNFPKFGTEFTEESQLNYTSGEIFTSLPDNINAYMFYKYGAKTGLTSGEVTSDGAIVRTTGSLEVRDECELHNQIEISLVDSTPLAEPGDSGALVLLAPKDKPNDLRALGIVTGGCTTYQVFYVTPIWEILRALNLPLKLKKFEGPARMITEDEDMQEQERDTRNIDPNEIERHLNEKIENEIGKVNDEIGNIETEVETMKSKIGEVEGKVDNISSEMSTKNDLNKMATKMDLNQVATETGLNELAATTTSTIENMFAQYFAPRKTSQNNVDGNRLNDAGDQS